MTNLLSYEYCWHFQESTTCSYLYFTNIKLVIFLLEKPNVCGKYGFQIVFQWHLYGKTNNMRVKKWEWDVSILQNASRCWLLSFPFTSYSYVHVFLHMYWLFVYEHVSIIFNKLNMIFYRIRNYFLNTHV